MLTGYLIPFIVVLSLIVFIHEMGHYLVGRLSGIRVLAFSLGFGPELIGFNDRHGTRWKLSAIPLGGYVRFFGDADAASTTDAEAYAALSPEEKAQTLNGAALWKRAATVAAGPIFNFLLAIAIFSATFFLYGRAVSDPIVAEVKADSAAAAAGVMPGDVLSALDGERMTTFEDVVRYVSLRPGVPIAVTLKRGDKVIHVTITPRPTEVKDRFGNVSEVGQIGVITTASVGKFRVEKLNLGQSLVEGARQTWSIVTSTVDYLRGLIAGRLSADELGGPIRVAQASGQVATLGIGALLQLAAVLSVSIGMINLMPVPVLDGGHLMLYLLEAFRGKPVSARVQDIAFRIGFAMILGLMVFATWNDISRLIG
ncbi:RIP metalloprotease RseP [Allorhizobium sp. BGMRC 0089]|nr:RIP metalloprotease RseP [Allorhizobium sonneratiae]MCM2293626.1 RIP metalloprotease RseP [Allorhizobium sonneratiae]